MIEAKNYEIESKDVKETCIISGLEYGSEKERLDRIKEIYKLCESKGVEIILNCGNFVSEYKINDETKINSESQSKIQIENVVKKHPYSNRIKLYTISGTSELSFLKKENIDVCEEISKIRKDIVYLGKKNVNINISGLKIKLYSNPIKNGFYSHTPTPQAIEKIIDNNLNLDLICVGPDAIATVCHYKKANILYVPSVADYGYSHHGVWFAQIKTDKKDPTKKVYSLYDYSLKSSYDRETEELFKNEKQKDKRINAFPFGIEVR